VTATEAAREHLAHEIAHFSHLLPSQGPIGTFIHHNTLHGLQHLPFHEALAEGQRLIGGRGYLPAETFRRHHASGRISDEDLDAALDEQVADANAVLVPRADGRDVTARDVRRAHLVHGVEPLDVSALRFLHDESAILRRLRRDLPAAARAAIVDTDALEASLDQVGRVSTIADWLLIHTGVDVPGWVQAEVRRSGPAADDESDGWLTKLGIPSDRWGSYRALIDQRLAGEGLAVPMARSLWLRAEAGALETLAPRHFGAGGTFPALSRRLGADVEGFAVSSLWQACLAAYGLPDPLSPSDPVHLTAHDPRADAEAIHAAMHEVERSDRPPSRAMTEAAERGLALAIDHATRDGTHAELLRDLTGDDVAARVDEIMIKRCAVFLDEGQAAWRLPHRELGFYRSWRALGASDRSLDLEDAPGWREALARLPERSDDAVIDLLEVLGVPEKNWGEYCGRLLMRLSGWAGLISWRETRPAYPRQQVQPISLVDFLAVRLFYETVLLRGLSRRTWGIEPGTDALREHFRGRVSELLVRRAFHAGELPDGLAERVRSRLRSATGGAELGWDVLGDMVWLLRQARSSDEPLARGAWRLFQLAQLLGLGAGEVRSLRPEERDRLVAELDAFPRAAQDAVWQTAYERHYREQVLNALAQNRGRGRWRTRGTRPRSQVVFCIDEREEAIRRHFEEIGPEHETLGAAGFFGIAMRYRGLEEHATTPLCPPVITPIHLVAEVARPTEAEPLHVREQRSKWWEVFQNAYWETKRNFLSAYFLVDLVGLFQSVPLFATVLAPHRTAAVRARVGRGLLPDVRTELAVTRADGAEGPPGALLEGFATAEQAERIEAMLRNIGLTAGFARLIVFTGHGSSSVNNPHESAHDCGACGGKHGGPNGRAFAAMANRPEVRALLRERGVDIPEDTHFVGAQHNTCSERYTFFDVEDVPATHVEEWAALVRDLDEARARSAQERCRRFASAPKDASPARSLRHIEGRSLDLSQVRPEWGHATNAFAVVGRRSITQGVFFDRRPFLISYDPTIDPEGTVLERVLLAVGPVGAGINLEYYFSTVDNQHWGADTKVPHNVCGMVGVMEGALSDLRTGLPKQMVEVHEPMRLQLVVEAKVEVLGAIYGRQTSIQELLGNAWVHLIAMDPDTGELRTFLPRGEFVLWDRPLSPLPVVPSSFEWYRGKTDFLPPAHIVPEARAGLM